MLINANDKMLEMLDFSKTTMVIDEKIKCNKILENKMYENKSLAIAMEIDELSKANEKLNNDAKKNNERYNNKGYRQNNYGANGYNRQNAMYQIQDGRNQQVSYANKNYSRNVTCFYCGEVGHIKADCRTLKRELFKKNGQLQYRNNKQYQ